MPSPIDATCESTTWMSRSGSMARAIWALLIVPDSVPATWTETIASAPAVEGRFVGRLEVAGRHAAVVGNGASGAVIRVPELVGRHVDARLEGVRPEVDEERDDRDPGRGGLAGSKSDAESVTIATRPKVASSSSLPGGVAGMIAGMIRAGVQPDGVSRYASARWIVAVGRAAGTFTLRFSTGLTGAMLGSYLAKLPEYGGEPVEPGRRRPVRARPSTSPSSSCRRSSASCPTGRATTG